MLSLTAEAAELLRSLAATEAQDPDTALRFIQDTGGFGVSTDSPRDTDVVIAYDGRVLLVVDNDLAQRLGDCTLAINHTSAGPELALISGVDGLPAVTLDAADADGRAS